ncbi:MAG TPA: transcription elongation factor GreA [Solirubrobacteraceae bacterium]|jgi:transcription elongation factor GreA
MTEGAITAEGLVALRAELEELETTARHEMSARILAAREIGDLKENADYHIAKEDQAHLETKILRLKQRLREARVVEDGPVGDQVAFGATVTVVDEASDRQATYRIVGPTEADATAGLLSAESPVARALIGKRAGDVAVVATPSGSRRLRVEGLS